MGEQRGRLQRGALEGYCTTQTPVTPTQEAHNRFGYRVSTQTSQLDMFMTRTPDERVDAEDYYFAYEVICTWNSE